MTATEKSDKSYTDKWKDVLNFLYNKSDGTVLGRNGKRWCHILAFYIFFYGLVAAVFAIVMAIFMQTLHSDSPKFQEILGSSPGMGFRPHPTEAQPGNDFKNILIKVAPKTPDNNQPWIAALSSFLEPYGDQSSVNFKDCQNGNVPAPGANEICRVPIPTDLTCNGDTGFGFNAGQPCVIVKLNRIINWTPVSYNGLSDLPADLAVSYEKWDNLPSLSSIYRADQIYITCEGESVEKRLRDSTSIGKLRISPNSIPFYYYPYTKQPGYLSPFVMVQFLGPTLDVKFSVTCKAWAKNIEQNHMYGYGIARFELLIQSA